MFSGRNIHNMSDVELSSFIKDMIETNEPESIRLDYKETLNIKTEAGKKELCKDVSSFANEQGGAVLYGVPETCIDDLPRPKPLSECGIDIDPRLPERIENVLLSAVQPVLPSLVIKVIDIEEIKPRQLLLVYHPESYWKPHMVEGYKDQRYYRRGNYRTIQMTERNVEALYQAREASRLYAKDFLESKSFGITSVKQLRAVVCPIMPGRYKEKMLQGNFRDWIDQNGPKCETHTRRGSWEPFLDGCRFLSHPEGSIYGKQYEIRLFHNGAICLNLDGNSYISSKYLHIEAIKDDLHDLFLDFFGRVSTGLDLSGPVVINLFMIGIADTIFVRDEIEERRLNGIKLNVKEGRPEYYNGHSFNSLSDLNQLTINVDQIRFDEESSVDEIIYQPKKVIGRIVSRIGMAFGRWQDEPID